MTDSAEESDHDENSLSTTQSGNTPGVSTSSRNSTPQPMSSKGRPGMS